MDIERVRVQLDGLARDRLAWPEFVAAADAVLNSVIAFDRSVGTRLTPAP